MAIATATSLDVYVGGKLLFEDVSFKLEPRERMTLSGPQRRRQVDPAAGARRRAGARRGLARPCSAAPGSPSTTSARRANRRRRSASTSSPAAPTCSRPRPSWRGWRGKWAATASEETMRAYAAAQQRLEAGGGYRWRDDVLAVLRGLGFERRARRALALDLLRRRADPRLAGPRPRHPSRPAAARRADEPSRHPLAGVARGLPGRPRRRRRPRRPRPLVPRGGRHLGAGAGGAARPLLRRPLARLAPGAGGAADRPRQSDRAPAGGDRADGALRRALPLQGDEGAPGAVAGEA